MKKILVVLLSLTLIFAFTGCTSSNNGAAEDIEIKTQKVVTSNTDDDDDNISNTENAVENANEKDYDFSSYEMLSCQICQFFLRINVVAVPPDCSQIQM